MTANRSSMTGPDSNVSRINMTSLLAGFALGAVLASFAWVQILPGEAGGVDPNDFVVFQGGDGPAPVEGDGDEVAEGPQRRVITQGDEGEAGSGGGGGGVDFGEGVTGGGSGGDAGGPEGSGDTTGVSASKIKFGATYVRGGIAQDFLGEVRDAMEAVRTRVNGSGGVHGRQLEIVYKDDSWDPVRGQQFIENLIKQDQVFALAVSPSSEGLNAAAEAGLFANNGVPVVGADGLNNSQFVDVRTGQANQWIWPVATATTTNVHIIMQEAAKRADAAGEKLEPGIVFGNTYKFGVEGAFAFNAAYCRTQGGEVGSDGNCNDTSKNIPGFGPSETGCNKGSRYCGIDGGWTGGTQDDNFAGACQECNFILVLLEPATALTWLTKSQAPRPTDSNLEFGMAGAQPLFTQSFADECGAPCDEMVVWTGYKPPIGEFRSEQAVADYQQDFTAQKSTADVNNQFSMGGYIGMELLVEALDQAGKDLTRGKLVDALNSLTLETGLTAAPKLSWSASNKYANNAAHGYQVDWNENQGIASFKRKTGFVTDPWLGQDNILP